MPQGSTVNGAQKVVTTDSSGDVLSSTNGAAHVTLADAIAGERLPNSATNSYLSVINECNIAMPTGAVAFSTSTANDACLIGVCITTPLQGTVTIGGFEDTSGAAKSIVIPASVLSNPPVASDTYVMGFYNYHGAINTKGALTVTIASGLDTGDVQVLWRSRA